MCNTVAHIGIGFVSQKLLDKIYKKISTNESRINLSSTDTTIGVVLGSMIPDTEPLSYILLHKLIGYKPPCGHFIFHSFVLSPFLILFFSSMTYKYLNIKGINCTKENLIAGFSIGWGMHVFVDALVHSPKQQWPFFPISTNNPFYQHLFTRTDGNIIGIIAFIIFFSYFVYYYYFNKRD